MHSLRDDLSAMAVSSPYGGLTQRVHEAMDELNSDETFYVPHQEAEELFNLPGLFTNPMPTCWLFTIKEQRKKSAFFTNTKSRFAPVGFDGGDLRV